MRFKWLAVISPLLFLAMLPNLVYATEGVVDISELDQRLGEMLGVGEFAGGLLATTILLTITLLPLTFLCLMLKANPTMPLLIFGIIEVGFGVAVGWLSVWIFIMLILIEAFFYAKLATGVFGGES